MEKSKEQKMTLEDAVRFAKAILVIERSPASALHSLIGRYDNPREAVEKAIIETDYKPIDWLG